MRTSWSVSVLMCVAGFAMSGCAQYMERKDTAFLGAGNAVATNATIHVIDPWPRHAGHTALTSDGDRLQRGVERYRRNPRFAVPGGTAAGGGDAGTPAGAQNGGGASPASPAR